MKGSMASPNNKRVYLRCPWCGKQPVPLKRGRIQSHVTPGNIRCVGVGQPMKENPNEHN